MTRSTREAPNSHYSRSMTAGRYSISPFHTTLACEQALRGTGAGVEGQSLGEPARRLIQRIYSSLLRKALKLRTKTRFSNTHGINESSCSCYSRELIATNKVGEEPIGSSVGLSFLLLIPQTT